jgi:glyoxylase-like metal-dependent hydrolase (beta-lactamase superfamily II)
MFLEKTPIERLKEEGMESNTWQNLNEPVEISDGVWWVGSGGRSFLRRNSYLRIFKGGGKTANLLIDPGPPVDLESLSGKVSTLIGGLSKVNMVFANHQDPDVVGNLPYLAKLNPKCFFLATEDTWRLVNLFGLEMKNFRPVERFTNQRILLPSGQRLQFILTPFCHFRGAVMLYDLESRILFTGDLLGGIAAPQLAATEANWTGIKAFHQLYMPSNDALRLAVERIRHLDPAPIMIAPQHGGLIQGELIETFLARMEALPVGLDILSSLKEQLPLLIDAVNEIVTEGRQILGEEKVAAIMRSFHPDGTYPSFFSLARNDTVTAINGEPFETIEALVKLFFRDLDNRQKNLFTTRILRTMLDRNLPPFDILLQQESGETIELLEEE